VLSVSVFADDVVPSLFSVAAGVLDTSFLCFFLVNKEPFFPLLFLEFGSCLLPEETGSFEADFSTNDSCLTARAQVVPTSTGARALSTYTGELVLFTSTGAEMFCSLEEVPEGRCLALSNCRQTSLVA